MSITSFFEQIGAPLANNRWSWGGIDEAQRRVFLRAWQDQTRTIEGKRYVRLAHHEKYRDNPENLGYRERLRHLEAVRHSHEAFVVMCKAKDVSERPRTIESFDSRDVFKIGEVRSIDGDEWGEIVSRVSVKDLR